jgi:hypothetical protein
LVQNSDLQIHIVSCIVIVGSGGGSLPAGPSSDIRQHAAVAPPPSPAIDNIAVGRAVAGNLDSTHTGFRSSSCPRNPTLPECRRVVGLTKATRSDGVALCTCHVYPGSLRLGASTYIVLCMYINLHTCTY